MGESRRFDDAEFRCSYVAALSYLMDVVFVIDK
jgi:hypothetical protein